MSSLKLAIQMLTIPIVCPTGLSVSTLIPTKVVENSMTDNTGGRTEETSEGTHSYYHATFPEHLQQADDAARTDPFSAFIFDNLPTDMNRNPMEDQLGVAAGELTLDDIFADMDPQPLFRDEELEFFNFLDDSSSLGGEGASSHILAQSQGVIPPPPSFRNVSTRASPHVTTGTHPGIVIPSHITADASFQPMPQFSQSRQPAPQRIAPNRADLRLTMPSPSIDSFSFAGPSMQMHTMPISQTPLLETFSPWTFDPTPTLEEIGSPFSEANAKTEIPITTTSKPASPTIKIGRRRLSKDSDTPSTESPSQLGRPTKTSHNMIEKRYRLKLNDKIMSLRNAVPALRGPASDMTEDQQLLDSGRGGTSGKLNKGTVLTKATEYIQQLEEEKEALEQQVARLKEQLAATSGQGFEWGGVAAASKTHNVGTGYTVSTNGMLSPESCISLMSPEAEGTLFTDEFTKLRPDVFEKLRPRKRARTGRAQS